jgi:hypothetical protein
MTGGVEGVCFEKTFKSRSFGDLVHSVSLLGLTFVGNNRSVASLYVRGNLIFFVYIGSASTRTNFRLRLFVCSVSVSNSFGSSLF